MKKIIPTVRTWCLPEDLGEERLEELHKGISSVMTSIPEIGVDDERFMLDLFPGDRMTHGLGSEIKFEITDLPQCDKEILDRLTCEIGKFVKMMFPLANVFGKAECFNPEAGYWSSH